jgi:transposase
LTTKIHACVDALGNPVRLILTAGNAADITQGPALIESFSADAVVADKGYDSDTFVDLIVAAGLSRSSRHAAIGSHHARSTHTATKPEISSSDSSAASNSSAASLRATRYDKLALRFNAFLQLTCVYIWLL